jgi:hypothetical protein
MIPEPSGRFRLAQPPSARRSSVIKTVGNPKGSFQPLAFPTTREAAVIDPRERQGAAPVQADRRGTLAVPNSRVGLVFAARDSLFHSVGRHPVENRR